MESRLMTAGLRGSRITSLLKDTSSPRDSTQAANLYARLFVALSAISWLENRDKRVLLRYIINSFISCWTSPERTGKVCAEMSRLCLRRPSCYNRDCKLHVVEFILIFFRTRYRNDSTLESLARERVECVRPVQKHWSLFKSNTLPTVVNRW